jgi:hypothetical protein
MDRLPLPIEKQMISDWKFSNALSASTNFHHIHIIVSKEVDGVQVGDIDIDDVHDIRPGRTKEE